MDVLTDSFRAALDGEPSVVALLDAAGLVRYLNRAWTASAERDRAPASCRAERVLGRRYLDFIAGELRQHFAAALRRSIALGPGFRSVWMHGECNTPELSRLLTTRISTLWRERDVDGHLIHNEVDVLGPLEARYRPTDLPVDRLRDEHGLVVQCGCCRRVQLPASDRWVMHLDLLASPAPGTSHGLCGLCLETYYPDPGDRD